MRTFRLGAIALTAFILLGAHVSRAAAIAGELWLDRPVLARGPTLEEVAKLSAPNATFTTDAIDFDSTVSDFYVGPFLHNPIFSDPSVAGRDLYSVVILLTGTVALQAGDNRFLLVHDDGVQLFIDGIGLVVDEPDPTPPVSELINVIAPAIGDYAFRLSYGSCCAPPAKLIWTNYIPTDIPEPGSLTLLGTALAGLGAAITSRRRGA